jgi:hypothetical protein
MKKASPISILFALLQLIGSVLGGFFPAIIQFVTVLFGGIDNLSAGLLLLVAKFLLYIIVAVLVLARRPWAPLVACLAGTIGVLSGTSALMKSQLDQPGLAYLAFHLMYLSWFTYLLVQQRREAEQPDAEVQSEGAPSD